MPADGGKIMQWMYLQDKDQFQLLLRSRNFSQRDGLESHINCPNRETEDPKVGQRKKLQTVEVSCDIEGWRKAKDPYLKLLQLNSNNSLQTKIVFTLTERYRHISKLTGNILK